MPSLKDIIKYHVQHSYFFHLIKKNTKNLDALVCVLNTPLNINNNLYYERQYSYFDGILHVKDLVTEKSKKYQISKVLAGPAIIFDVMILAQKYNLDDNLIIITDENNKMLDNQDFTNIALSNLSDSERQAEANLYSYALAIWTSNVSSETESEEEKFLINCVKNGGLL